MNLQLKECLFCKRKLPIGYYHHNRVSRDGRWAWCKECEKKSTYYERKNIRDKKMNYIVSFSGGKDSTAMLLKLVEEGRQIDAVIYFDCGSFEWPQMSDHINQIEKDTGLKIIRVAAHKDFYDLATELQPGNREINGWPTPMLRWCTMLKINLIKQSLRIFRPYVQYIGFSADEEDRVLKASIKGNNVNRNRFFTNQFPIVEWGMTEKDCLEYCLKKGYKWGGLYDHFSRVSCWCCPLQNNTDLTKLCRYHPEMWYKLKEWNKKMPVHFKNDTDIFSKIEKKAELL